MAEDGVIECALASRGRCKSGQPKKDAAGAAFYFSEQSMKWESQASLEASPNPGRVLCLLC